jgi:periplasmic protein TonB
MTQSLATQSVLGENDGLEPVSLALTRASSAAPAPIGEPPGLLRASGSSRWEVALVLGFSALLHAGAAAAALSSRDSGRTARPLSRVELEMSRPPQRVTPPPAPPPPVAKPEVKPLAALHPRERAPEPLPTTPAQPEAPVDTGSSAPASEDGELFAGSGGPGTVAPPPPPAPKAVLPAAAAPVVQAREGANYLKNPRPGYPSLARREGWEGTTMVRVQVGENGRPRSVQVQRSSGREVLDNAATEAVKKWTFAPATQGGQPVSGWVTVPIVFKLQ